MDWSTSFGLFALLILVLANGFFVATEFAVVAVRRSRLEQLAREGHGRPRLAHQIVARLDAYIAACQLGITMASLALGWTGEPALAHILEPPIRSAGSRSAKAPRPELRRPPGGCSPSGRAGFAAFRASSRTVAATAVARLSAPRPIMTASGPEPSRLEAGAGVRAGLGAAVGERDPAGARCGDERAPRMGALDTSPPPVLAVLSRQLDQWRKRRGSR